MERFDRLIRMLTTAASRRNVFTRLAGGALAAQLDALGVEHAEATRHHKRRKNGGGNHNHRHERQNRLAIPPPPLRAVPIVRTDATCTSPEVGVIVIGEEDSRLAQTFTALSSGSLVRAGLD